MEILKKAKRFRDTPRIVFFKEHLPDN